MKRESPPDGIRTRVTRVKVLCPSPLDDGKLSRAQNMTHLTFCQDVFYADFKFPIF